MKTLNTSKITRNLILAAVGAFMATLVIAPIAPTVGADTIPDLSGSQFSEDDED